MLCLRKDQRQRAKRTGLVGHGAPCEVHGVQADSGRLEQARVRLSLLNLRQHRERRNHHTQDQVDADEELVGGTAVRPRVEGEEETDSGDGQCVLEEGEEEQSAVPSLRLGLLVPSHLATAGTAW